MRNTPCASRRFNGQYLLILKQSRIFPCDCTVTVIGRGCGYTPLCVCTGLWPSYIMAALEHFSTAAVLAPHTACNVCIIAHGLLTPSSSTPAICFLCYFPTSSLPVVSRAVRLRFFEILWKVVESNHRSCKYYILVAPFTSLYLPCILSLISHCDRSHCDRSRSQSWLFSVAICPVSFNAILSQ